MKKSRYSDSQILAILNQAEAGTPVAALCREHGMSSATFYKWRAKYGGMDALLFYNAATTSKWKSLLPVRVAAISVCDMSMPITDSITKGFQFVMCTHGGNFRKVKGEKKHMEGWGGGIVD